MSPPRVGSDGRTAADDSNDAVFKALADPSRRELLDRLNSSNGQTLTDLCAGLTMARQSVTKHLDILERANLITTLRRGRSKLHYLNAAPINDIAERWIDRYHRQHAQTLSALKSTLEAPTVANSFVYSTYIRTTPEALWAALTDPEIMKQYWGVALRSDWTPGATVQWGDAPSEDDTVVLEVIRHRRLSYTWHNYQPEHAQLFGWDEARLATLRQEPASKVTFEIEPVGDAVKLTVVHDGFASDTEMLRAASGRKPESGGWPALLAKLKTLLETGDTFQLPAEQDATPTT
jgi:uncharacterized protein YndB with AHSA1/START domain/DNA-binding transcriptional ArsR family regulator